MPIVRRLRETSLLDLRHTDGTLHGSMVSGRVEEVLTARSAQALSMIPAGAPQDAAWRQLSGPDGFGPFYAAPDRLSDDWLYPDPSRVFPDRLVHFDRLSGRETVIPLPPSLVGQLAGWIGSWQREAAAPRGGAARDLFDALDEAGAFGPEETDTPPIQPVTFIGHASALIRGGATRLLLDPFHLPQDPAQSHGYRPMAPFRWDIDAILVTHSHPDHFHTGTLLRFGPDVPVYVPYVSRESVLSIDMAARLREIGFRNVRTLAWNETVRIGDCTVTALPFHGEQPTAGAVLNPEVRNVGNLYLVEAAGRRYAFLADAGQDFMGSARGVAEDAHRRFGPADVVFCGYRSWSLYPIQLLGSSVGRYALFVPPHLRLARQTLMNGPDEALDIAEAWGARTLVPYADGGAPWYWDNGLGPALDRPAAENTHFDPPPDCVLAAAGRRSTAEGDAVASAVRVAILRPGESLPADPMGAVERHPGHLWPYGDVARHVPAVELRATRKKVLLRLVAPHALKALGLSVTPADAQALADELRRETGLTAAADMRAFLDTHGLDAAAFAELMREWAGSNALERHFRAEIDRRLPSQLALQAMPVFARERLRP